MGPAQTRYVLKPSMIEINRVELYGELVEEPRSGTTPGDGQSWASIRILTLHTFDTRDGKRAVRKDWFTVKLWGRQADYAVLNLGTGSQVFISAHLKTEKWIDPSSKEKRYSLVIVADEIQGATVGEDDAFPVAPEASGVGSEDHRALSPPAGGGESTSQTSVPQPAAAQPTTAGGAQADAAEEEPQDPGVDVSTEEYEQQHGLQPIPWPKAKR